MAVTQEQKAELVEKFGKAKKDSGSPEVQIAILTERIKDLTRHLDTNPKDYSTLRGLRAMVSKRTSLLAYYKRHNPIDAYKKLIESLGIRK